MTPRVLGWGFSVVEEPPPPAGPRRKEISFPGDPNLNFTYEESAYFSEWAVEPYGDGFIIRQVPEPAACLLVLAGAASLLRRRR
jgi:hypothetical protein